MLCIVILHVGELYHFTCGHSYVKVFLHRGVFKLSFIFLPIGILELCNMTLNVGIFEFCNITLYASALTKSFDE